ncbi:XrtA-associated tyrosine autokinase [Nitrococcus mobilis]|uniref:Protein-tyrosine kinase n=1 Tax=Nitrococcus mobilis Nb-231 TaxID=314278 RepID=A4BSK5_9GAMM|nr:XrtA-associated tyrosine autokinase [Nitrococcus mobilis]EAR21275.1 protein-tyrosine kinase [Nitrococcus mobilis Nb-231]
MNTIEKALKKSGRSRQSARAQLPDRGNAEDEQRAESAQSIAPLTLPELPEGSAFHVLDVGHMKSQGLLTPEDSRSPLAEEFRMVKRPIINNAFGTRADCVRSGNLVMITSALPREGKSFCTINLALSIAQEVDRTVLLVDADVARPAIPRYLGIRAEVGLLDVLGGEDIDLADAIVRTSIPNLSIVMAGANHKRSTELLASEAMTQLTAEMAERYPDRIVLFDSPPLLATSEASVLAAHMGQVVLVVEAERVPEEAVRGALEQLKRCDVVMTLLNKACRVPGIDYGYGYGYGYGHYHKS